MPYVTALRGERNGGEGRYFCHRALWSPSPDFVHAARGWRSGGPKPVNLSLGTSPLSPLSPLLRRVTLEGSRFHFDLYTRKGDLGNEVQKYEY